MKDVEVVLVKKMTHDEYLQMLPKFRKEGWQSKCYQVGVQSYITEQHK